MIKQEVQLELRNINIDNSNIYNNATAYYTSWSKWSKCKNCMQKRIKYCIANKCRESRITEERPCDRKRCDRKLRTKVYDKMNVIRNAVSKYFFQVIHTNVCVLYSMN